MKNIQITQGKFALVDDEDFAFLSQWKWQAITDPKTGTVYAGRSSRNNEGEQRHTIRMHRVIMSAEYGVLIDHRDGNGLNNCKANLRIATRRQNGANRRTFRKQFKGIEQKGNRFGAHIRTNGRLVHLGYFTTELDAAKAYDAAATRHFGEFARLNFPVEDVAKALDAIAEV